ncbi:MAG: hypothetical protein JRH15_03645 [Deltaproteobacteria bacterium]|nr:hypothetical protein [Deltaproteobacteria bacterium]
MFTESKLSGGKRVVGGSISVYNSSKTVLVEGKTNDQGKFSFKLPEKPPLVVELNAGMGHMAKWTIQPEDVEEESAPRANPPNIITADTGEPTSKPIAGAAPLTADELAALIETVLDRKLKPIKYMLADTRHKAPSLSEIVGGIGYIIGLVGIAAYFRNRKSKSE